MVYNKYQELANIDVYLGDEIRRKSLASDPYLEIYGRQNLDKKLSRMKPMFWYIMSVSNVI